MSITRYNPEHITFVVRCDDVNVELPAGIKASRLVEWTREGQFEGIQFVLAVQDRVADDISEVVAKTVVELARIEGSNLTADTIAFCQEYDALPVDCAAFEGGRVLRSEAA